MPLILAMVVLAVLAGVVAWIASTGWLARSGLEDLARHRRLSRGTDPAQLTADRAVDTARRTHALATEALAATLDRWYELRSTLGIGTPLEGEYPAVRDALDGDPAFVRLLERANDALVDSATDRPSRVADLLTDAARLDALTLAIRENVHRARPTPGRGERH